MKKGLALVLALVFVMSLAACGADSSTNDLTDKFIGKWESENGNVVVFYKDGSCNYTKDSKDYVLYTPYENNTIAFTFQYENWGTKQTSVEFMSYSFEGDTLKISGIAYSKLKS